TLGKVIKVDYNTTTGKIRKFVRFSIVVDLKKPLKAFIGINGTFYCVEYKGLSSICYQCGCYGHTQENYLKLIKNMEMSHPSASTTKPSPPMAEKMAAGHSCFNPWMQAQGKKIRPMQQKVTNRNYEKKFTDDKVTPKNSRFDILVDLEEIGFEEDTRDMRAKILVLYWKRKMFKSIVKRKNNQKMKGSSTISGCAIKRRGHSGGPRIDKTSIAMKETTKKGHKVRKRVEHKRPSTQGMTEWVESLLNEFDVLAKALGFEFKHEVPTEAVLREFDGLGENDMLEDSVV
ncbi:hypothetical protein Gorai_008610, partial [Gossypium raimondii]|nr:hypothetical protein [Gossypium raimondii]